MPDPRSVFVVLVLVLKLMSRHDLLLDHQD